MSDFDRINSLNTNTNDEVANENNDDSDNNLTQNVDNDATAANTLHRNNFTARDHLFQAMFSRIALTYDRTFPPFARRFIEFMLLITALSVLFILIYIHLAFVKAPITCLDNFSFDELVEQDDVSLKHMVIRVEILNNPPLNYGIYNSYSKEYDDFSASDLDKNSSAVVRSKNDFSQLSMFLNIIHKKCHKGMATSDRDSKDSSDGKNNQDNSKDGSNADANQSEGSLYKLFHFPINPIIEKAEYWREKLSVRAMAPFRQTFNDLELFAKSVFTEEKYIMEYSLEYGLLRLSPQTRERLNIPVHFILLDATKDKCFGNALSRFILEEFVGYDQIIIGSLKRLAERQSGKGYVRNVVSGEHYRFVNSWMSRTSYLAAGFIMIIFTLSVSMLLRYSHHQIFVFIVDLLRMLENNLQFSFPAAPLLTVVLALVGMEAIMSEFFNDTSTAFYTILIIWLADQYEAVCCRTYVSKRHWPRYFYLYHFAFYAYHYRFNGQFSGLALLCSWLFIQHSMFFFFHHYELPRLMQGIAVRAIMDSLVVERAENTSLTPSPGYPNDDEDSDMPGGDRRDDDQGPGSSSMPSPRTSNGTLPRMGDYKPPRGNEDGASPSDPSGENHRSNNNISSEIFLSTIQPIEKSSLTKQRFTVKKSYLPPSFIPKRFPIEMKRTSFLSQDRKRALRIVPNFASYLLSFVEEAVDSCVRNNTGMMSVHELYSGFLDQVYSIIVIWIIMVSLSDGTQQLEQTCLQEWKKSEERRRRVVTEEESHGIICDGDSRCKRIHTKAVVKPKPYFTVSRDYNDHKNVTNRRLSWLPRDLVPRQKLLFAEKQAVSMKMFHQVALSTEMIWKDIFTLIYVSGIKGVPGKHPSTLVKCPVSYKLIRSVICGDVLDLCTYITCSLIRGSYDLANAGVNQRSYVTTSLTTLSDVSESSTNHSDETMVDWSQRRCSESPAIDESHSMAQCTQPRYLQSQKSLDNHYHKVEATYTPMVCIATSSSEVPMHEVSRCSSGVSESSDVCASNPIIEPPGDSSLVTDSVTPPPVSRQSLNVFPRQYGNINKEESYEIEGEVQGQHTVVSEYTVEDSHMTVKVVEEEQALGDKYMARLSLDLSGYLHTVDDAVAPGTSSIPLIDLFPDDS